MYAPVKAVSQMRKTEDSRTVSHANQSQLKLHQQAARQQPKVIRRRDQTRASRAQLQSSRQPAAIRRPGGVEQGASRLFLMVKAINAVKSIERQKVPRRPQ